MMPTIKRSFNILLLLMILVTITLLFARPIEKTVVVTKEIPVKEAVFIPVPASSRFFSELPEQYMTLCRIVESEAGGESAEARQLIAEVLIQKYSDCYTFSDMVATPHMFANAERIPYMTIQDSTYKAVNKAFDNPIPLNAQYFCSSEIANDFPSLFLIPIYEVQRSDSVVFFRKGD